MLVLRVPNSAVAAASGRPNYNSVKIVNNNTGEEIEVRVLENKGRVKFGIVAPRSIIVEHPAKGDK